MGAGTASAAGGGPGLGPAGSGPGARLRYQAGGAGSSAYPRPAGWPATLGRFWSHDYAQAIVPDPDPSHVWLLTRSATFRVFDDSGLDGSYENAFPSSERRQLIKTATGWELTGLDGTVDRFDDSGRWTETTDSHGNAKVATYSGPMLTSVAFPDGRQENFAYHPGGKLASITEVGVDLTTTRIWSYTWSGDDLARIDRPDGTAWEMSYGDPARSGYMTRLELVGTDTGRRFERGWEYDAEGNVVRMWRGAADFTDAAAIEKWSFDFDDPSLPVLTQVTDPLGNVSTYTFGRDPATAKPRIELISGDCPACGLGPNSQLSYDDPLNPLRKSRQIDGRGTETRYTYDARGQLTSRIEDFGGALERETAWAYDPVYPSSMTEIEEPSTTGSLLDFRRTVFSYDAAGNQDTRTIEGFESGAAFSHVTVTTYNSAGRPEVIDPPGYGTGDQTTFTYDSARGDLLEATRTDPLIGTTSYGYDAFNRRTSVTDPDGVITETVYDDLDRVLFLIRRGAVPADDLVTEHRYDAFGDLFQTVLPAGNVIEYGYDPAGRLRSIERKPDDDPSSHGERTVQTLNGFGQRVREERQRWDGAGWVVAAVDRFEYSTRCHLDRSIAGEAPGPESVTEYAYDCDGNRERMWDANHPSADQTAPATEVYAYDAFGRLVTVTQPWGGAGGGDAITRYGYDVQDHLTSVADAEGTVTEYVNSDRDLLTEETSEVSGVTSRSYNEHGELTSTTDARGVVRTRTVDERDRVTLVQYPDNSLNVTYTYDDPGVAFSLGRLTRIERGGAGVDYEYDRFGRLIRDGDLTYGYDRNGNRRTIGYPGGVTATYSYDLADRPMDGTNLNRSP